MAGDRLDAILDEHVSELAKHCVEAELRSYRSGRCLYQ